MLSLLSECASTARVDDTVPGLSFCLGMVAVRFPRSCDASIAFDRLRSIRTNPRLAFFNLPHLQRPVTASADNPLGFDATRWASQTLWNRVFAAALMSGPLGITVLGSLRLAPAGRERLGLPGGSLG